jgi:hypothetical protein
MFNLGRMNCSTTGQHVREESVTWARRASLFWLVHGL